MVNLGTVLDEYTESPDSTVPDEYPESPDSHRLNFELLNIGLVIYLISFELSQSSLQSFVILLKGSSFHNHKWDFTSYDFPFYIINYNTRNKKKIKNTLVIK